MEHGFSFLCGMLLAAVLPLLCRLVKAFWLRGKNRAFSLLILPAAGAGEDLERRAREQLLTLDERRGALLILTCGASEMEKAVAERLACEKKALCGEKEELISLLKGNDEVYKTLEVVLYS